MQDDQDVIGNKAEPGIYRHEICGKHISVNHPECGYCKVEEQAEQIEALTSTLRAAACPNCDGSGVIVLSGNIVRHEIEPCQWCAEREALLQENSDAER